MTVRATRMIESAARWLPLGAAALAFLPLLWCHAALRDLWWFGEDWALLDRMKNAGILRWSFQPSDATFVPLFKLLWGHLVFASHGSYFAMLVALWATHALNAALLARWMLRVGFGGAGTSLATAIFALSAANIETLASSAQWTVILGITFFLLAAEREARTNAGNASPSREWHRRIMLTVLCAASALAFSRGILAGAVLAVASVLPVDPRVPWSSRCRQAGACILPVVVVMAVVFFAAPGETSPSRIEWREAAEFAAWHWGLTPLHALLNPGSWGWRTTLLLTLIKLTLLVWALRHTSSTQRHMLIVVLLLDLSNAVVLGIARHHAGLTAVANSHDHYLEILCVLPFAAVGFEALLARVRFRAIRIAVAILCVATVAYHVARPWPREVDAFATRRGRTTREVLLYALNPPPMGAVPGMPLLSTARAKELIARYQLHSSSDTLSP